MRVTYIIEMVEKATQSGLSPSYSGPVPPGWFETGALRFAIAGFHNRAPVSRLFHRHSGPIDRNLELHRQPPRETKSLFACACETRHAQMCHDHGVSHPRSWRFAGGARHKPLCTRSKMTSYCRGRTPGFGAGHKTSSDTSGKAQKNPASQPKETPRESRSMVYIVPRRGHRGGALSP